MIVIAKPPLVSPQALCDALQREIEGGMRRRPFAMRLNDNAAPGVNGNIDSQPSACARNGDIRINTTVEILIDDLVQVVFGIGRKGFADIDLFS